MRSDNTPVIRAEPRALLFLLMIGLVLSAFGYARHWLDYDAVNAALRQHGAYTQYELMAQAVLPQITSETEFDHKWQVDEPPTQGFLTVLFFRSGTETPRPLRVYARNCGYTGHRAIVICDVRIIEWLEDRWWLNRTYLDSGERPEDQPPRYAIEPPCTKGRGCADIMMWLLAHEVGHVLAHHGPSHFAHAGLDQYVSNATLQQQRELVADRFAVKAAGAPGADDHFYGLVINALNIEIRRKACPEEDSGVRCQDILYGAGVLFPKGMLIKFAAGNSHPEFVVRTVRLLQEAESTYKMKFFGPLVEEAARALTLDETTP
jgi:hypothetical protein